MNTYKFIKYKDPDNHHDTSKVIVITETCDLLEILEEFQRFLQASGFIVKGQITIIDDDEEQASDAD